MSSFSIPKPVYQPVSIRRVFTVPPNLATTVGPAMIKVIGWSATILIVSMLIWQLAIAAPLLPKIASAVLLALVSCLAGISIGAGGAAAYIRDVQRLNKTLADQHHELEELNAIMLKQLNEEHELHPPTERV
jgi:hypothetical protein